MAHHNDKKDTLMIKKATIVIQNDGDVTTTEPVDGLTFAKVAGPIRPGAIVLAQDAANQELFVYRIKTLDAVQDGASTVQVDLSAKLKKDEISAVSQFANHTS